MLTQGCNDFETKSSRSALQLTEMLVNRGPHLLQTVGFPAGPRSAEESSRRYQEARTQGPLEQESHICSQQTVTSKMGSNRPIPIAGNRVRKARRAATGQAGVERQLQGQWGRPNRHVVYLRQIDAHPWQSQTATHAFCLATGLGA